MQLLRQQGRRREVLGDAAKGPEPAVAADAQGAHRLRANGCQRDSGLFRTAQDLAGEEKRSAGMWLAGRGWWRVKLMLSRIPQKHSAELPVGVPPGSDRGSHTTAQLGCPQGGRLKGPQ